MIAGRAMRIVLAAFAIGAVGLLTLIGFVRPTIASLDECGGTCSYGTPTIVLVAVPTVAVILAVGLLLWPAMLARPLAVASGIVAIALVGPVMQVPSAVLAAVILCVFGASTFLLAPPVGRGAGPWASGSWIIAMMAALVLWQLDASGFSYLVTDPVAPQPQPVFLVVGAVVLGAGLLSGALRRLEGPRTDS